MGGGSGDGSSGSNNGGGGGGGGKATAGAGAAGGARWASGMCELFPRTTSVTINMQWGDLCEDGHMMALADKCHKCARLLHAHFFCCENLTDAAMIALAGKWEVWKCGKCGSVEVWKLS